ncbi:MAG: phospholipase D-like domain-containing protein, partial [Pseudoxanthomonas sp.]
SAHGNVALKFRGAAALDLMRSERAAVEMSGADWPESLASLNAASSPHEVGTGIQTQIVTEGRIRDALLASVASARPGESLDIAVFYFSHRGLVKEFVAAQRRGVRLRVLLDPNEDAFGRKKNGIPNRQVALELHEAGVPLRWCDTHGEQCHAKFLLKRDAAGKAELIVGSANYTRRNLDDYNLESSVRVLASNDVAVMQQAVSYFEQSWSNTDGRLISVPYARYADTSRLRYWRYRFTEASGLSSF